MMSSHRTLSPHWLQTLVVLLLLFSPRAECGEVTRAARQADPRLEQRISLVAPRVHVGELLDRLAEKTKVIVEANRADGAADEHLTVFLNDVPLADAMNALWGLLSYDQAQWTWSRSGKEGRYRYRLERPLAAQQLPTRLASSLQSTFEVETADFLAALKMNPDEQRKASEKNPNIGLFLGHQRTREGLTLYAETLPPEKRLAVLRGEEKIQVAVRDLSVRGRAFVHSEWVTTPVLRRINDGPWERVPEPSWVRFGVERVPGALAPNLAIHLEGIGARGYAGGTPFERAWRKKLADLWRLPGDAADNPLTERKLEPPEGKGDPGTRLWLPERLGQFANAVPLSLIARVCPGDKNDPGPPYGKTVRAYLEQLAEQHNLQYKWRDGILLLAYPAWFLDEAEATRAPWEVVKQLREAEDRAGGALPVRELAAASAALSERQLLRLADEEFPALAHVARWRSLFLRMHQSPQLATRLLSPKGAPLAAVLPALRPGFEEGLLQPGKAAAVRLVETRIAVTDPLFQSAAYKATGAKPPTRSIAIELLTPGGHVLAQRLLHYGGRKGAAAPSAGPVGAP